MCSILNNNTKQRTRIIIKTINKMTKKQMINIANTAIDKNMDYEALRYSDAMYDEPELTDEVWDYVVEAKENGSLWFEKEYKEFLY